IDALWVPLVVLAVMAIAVFTASTLRFRRDLAPAGRGDSDTPETGA
ncbi:MAG: ABC transporter permease, partial [Actinobacteria bacterium]|nr:ABC transporter permease [Actinomycetota bacterium]